MSSQYARQSRNDYLVPSLRSCPRQPDKETKRFSSANLNAKIHNEINNRPKSINNSGINTRKYLNQNNCYALPVSVRPSKSKRAKPDITSAISLKPILVRGSVSCSSGVAIVFCIHTHTTLFRGIQPWIQFFAAKRGKHAL